MPCVIVTNDDYDEDQDQKQEEKLPLAENLIFMRYEHAEDQDDDANGGETRVGYVFYYPDLGEEGACFVIEADPDRTPALREELQQFEQWINKVLYAINEQKPLRTSSRSKSVLAEQDKRCARYCILSDLDVLLRQRVIADIFLGVDDSQLD